jgi:hypothetical protein
MIELSDKIWKTLEGGYGIPYDPSKILRKLADSAFTDDVQHIFDELWENLYHQGDVGTASYLAVTALISICIGKRSFDWNYIGLCVTIENARLRGDNPELPQEYDDLYFGSITKFETYLISNFKSITDKESQRLVLSLLATVNGQPDLGHAIQKLDEDILTEFNSQY